MKIKVPFQIILLLIASTLLVEAQVSPNPSKVAGSWLGKISVGTMDLRLVINLTLSGNDSLTATLDSPDQGAKGIPMGKVTLKGDSIIVDAPIIRGDYKALFTSDTTLSGTWSQSGNKTPLDLSLLPGGFTLNRPQEPKKPYPYTSEEIFFDNKADGIRLAGTLTLPKGEGPFAVAILISGSGPQNRDEELMGHKPFLVIADHLTRQGFAVLRYDDRGVGLSGGPMQGNTSLDFARDASSAMDYLKSRKEIDPSKIGFIGHSEGGLIAPIVASAREETAFIISLAGPGVKGDQLLFAQQAIIMRLSGVSEDIIKANRKMNSKFYSLIEKEYDNKVAESGIVKIYSKVLEKNKVVGEDKDAAINNIKASFNGLGYDWLRFFIKTDPGIYWKNVKCPVLALNGSKDTQVIAGDNLAAIKKGVSGNGNKNVEIHNIEGVNHLFQKCDTGLPKEYGTIEETVSPEVLDIITDWLKKNAR